MANTLFDKIWDAHIVQKVEDGCAESRRRTYAIIHRPSLLP